MAARHDSLAAATYGVPSLGGRVTNLRFYEGGSGMPPLEERAFSVRFEAATARFIYWQLDLAFPAPGRQLAVPVRCVFFKSDGTVFGESDVTIGVGPETTEEWASWGLGWSDPGHWPVGLYRLECQADGQLIAKRGFTMRD